jgi:SecD/SecF fusion protein
VTEITVQIPDKPELRDEIVQVFATPDPFQRLESVGKAVAGEMRNKAILAMIVALIAIVFYIWMRFGELKFGIAAIVALAHDVLMTMGAIAAADALSGTLVGRILGFTDIKINVEMIAAFLTIIGYSLNDTIVVFDRIRENLGGARRRKIDAEIVDLSVNQCLSRTLLTSLTTLIVVLTLYVIGGAVIHGFAFALIVGVVVGTYSSVFIASPILVDWDVITGFLGKLFRIITFRFGEPGRAVQR